MKKISLLVIIVSMLVGVSSCKSGGVNKPEEIGHHVFNILKELDGKGKEVFAKNFMTIEEVRDLGRNTKVVPELLLRNELTSLEKDEWVDNISNSERVIRKMAIDNEINWKKIEYSDFIYKIKHEESAAMYVEGVLTFVHDDKEYKLDTHSMWNGKEYLLVKIENAN